MIPEAAVEAAARVLGYDPDWHSETDLEENRWFLSRARQMLEAAAPHMLAQILELADEMDNVHGSIRGRVTTYQLRKALGVNDE